MNNEFILINWMSHIAFTIAMPIFFVIGKYILKKHFDYTKVFKLSIVIAFLSYIIFTLASIWIPFIISVGVLSIDIYFFILGDFVGFIIGSIILTEICYMIGREIHKKCQ